MGVCEGVGVDVGVGEFRFLVGVELLVTVLVGVILGVDVGVTVAVGVALRVGV